MEFQFVIPFRDMGDEHRNQIADWNSSRLKRWFGDDCVRWGFDDSGGTQFNRSRAINYGVERTKSSTEIIVILDADTTFGVREFDSVLREMRGNDSIPWMIPYSTYYRLDERTTDRILDNECSGFVTLLKDPEASYTHVFTDPPDPSTGYLSPVSGLLVVRKEDFIKVGGFCEGFNGWGYEDRAWVVAADLIIGKHERRPNSVWHLWHPEPHEKTEGQPHLAANRDLYEWFCKMADQGDVDAIRGMGGIK